MSNKMILDFRFVNRSSTVQILEYSDGKLKFQPKLHLFVHVCSFISCINLIKNPNYTIQHEKASTVNAS